MSEITPTTRVVRAGIESDSRYGDVVPPIHLSTTYAFESFGVGREFDYCRSGNPTRQMLSQALADLEGGEAAVVTSSGMAAITVVLHALAGPRVLLPHDCYGGTWRLFQALARQGILEVETIDFTDPTAVERGMATPPSLVWVETPSNPLLRITDLRTVVAAAHAVGALVVADNTFLSPALFKPLALGADLVVHSTTKFVNGHSDVVAGAIVCAREADHAEIAWWANTLGLTGSAFDCYLTLRGLRTLHVRMQAHERNAAAVAELLAGHRAVKAVHYPGLADHPGHELAARQQAGFGSLMSFDLGDERRVTAFLTGLRCFSLAESLGGVESLVAHPATMTHVAMPPDTQRAAGITPGLLRLSVGIENLDDLLADLSAGLDRAAGVTAGE